MRLTPLTLLATLLAFAKMAHIGDAANVPFWLIGGLLVADAATSLAFTWFDKADLYNRLNYWVKMRQLDRIKRKLEGKGYGK